MAQIQQSLLEQRKEQADHLARKQRVEASIRRIKQLYEPVRPPSLRRV